MSSLPRIHGRIAAKPRYHMHASVVEARHALVRREIDKRANREIFAGYILLAVALATIAAFVF